LRQARQYVRSRPTVPPHREIAYAEDLHRDPSLTVAVRSNQTSGRRWHQGAGLFLSLPFAHIYDNFDKFKCIEGSRDWIKPRNKDLIRDLRRYHDNARKTCTDAVRVAYGKKHDITWVPRGLCKLHLDSDDEASEED